jgi:hypothetical protein
MPDETVSATITIKAPAEAIFAILADPASHPAIDGTGWVRQALHPEHLTAPGQIFRMAMHHDNHPDKNYQMGWSAVPQFLGEHIQFPPFPPDHLRNSLDHLAGLAAPR